MKRSDYINEVKVLTIEREALQKEYKKQSLRINKRLARAEKQALDSYGRVDKLVLLNDDKCILDTEYNLEINKNLLRTRWVMFNIERIDAEPK